MLSEGLRFGVVAAAVQALHRKPSQGRLAAGGIPLAAFHVGAGAQAARNLKQVQVGYHGGGLRGGGDAGPGGN